MRLLAILPPFLLYTLTFPTARGSGLGVNCRGSTQCLTDKFKLPSEVSNLVEYFFGAVHHNIAPTTVYYLEDHIFCVKAIIGGICLFTQGNVPKEGVTGAAIETALGYLVQHGCKQCGSVPLSGNNDPSEKGILTINYVFQGVCDGVCPLSYGPDTPPHHRPGKPHESNPN